jgi:hypothetical protein
VNNWYAIMYLDTEFGGGGGGWNAWVLVVF